MTLRIGILTVSTRVAAGQMEDRGGPQVEEALTPLGARILRGLVTDDRSQIADRLREWVDGEGVDIILTTGGTGLGPFDVTPEATEDVCDRDVPGLAEAMRAAGLAHTPHAMLSRAVAGVRGHTLIVNLPGSPGGAREGVDTILPVLEHAAAIIRGGHH